MNLALFLFLGLACIVFGTALLDRTGKDKATNLICRGMQVVGILLLATFSLLLIF